MLAKEIFNILKNKFELLLGRLELALEPNVEHHYKYIIDRIESKEVQQQSKCIIYYKLIGCRKLLFDSAIELNKLALFSLFRPDHAQMIVSIATAEALMNYSKKELFDKLQNYIEFCNIKINGN